MIVLDGSYGEGGGQIVRTAVGLSALLGVPCRIERIRQGRPSPGLKAQHVAGIKALLRICRGEAEGLQVGSETLTFIPGRLRGGSYRIDVGTAGAIGLVLQTLMPACVGLPSRLTLTITGGTDVKWAPTVLYMKEVLLPILYRMGFKAEIQLLKRGYYPKGGGMISFSARGAELQGVDLRERGEVLGIYGVSHASKSLQSRRVAERQREAALSVLRKKGMEAEIRVRYEETPSPGSGMDLWALCEGSILGANSLGERGKRAETVGEEAALSLLRELDSGAALDRHLADQILPFLAIAKGPSIVSISEPTSHLETNLWVIGHFPHCRPLELQREGGRWIVRTKG